MYYNYCDASALTDIGRQRSNNEDAVLSLPEYGVFCVADGMGGAEDGEVASRAVVDALKNGFGAFDPALPEYQCGAFKTAQITKWFNAASRWIYDRAVSLGNKGSGSTVAVLFMDAARPDQACCLHAGDSRIYRYRKGKLRQITTDHSMAEEAGKKESELPAMMRGMITRAVGVKPSVKLEQTTTDVRQGDVFILCSDGLTKMLSDKQLAGMLAIQSARSAEIIARELIGAANDAGGVDNTSVAVVKVVEELPTPIRVSEFTGIPITSETVEETDFTQDCAATDTGIDSESPTPTPTPTPSTGESVLDGHALKTPTSGWDGPEGADRPRVLLSKKSIGISVATLLLMIVGFSLILNRGQNGASVPRMQPVVSVQIDCSSVGGENEPPVLLSYHQLGGSDEFKPIEGTVINLVPGNYELQAASLDYKSYIIPFTVESAETNLVLMIPRLIPEPVLQRLFDARQAVANKDFQGLEKILARESSGILQFAGHRSAWRDVEAAFSKRKENADKEQQKTFQIAKEAYVRQIGEVNQITGRTVAEVLEKYVSEDWKIAQTLSVEAERIRSNPLSGSKKYEEALAVVKHAMVKADKALRRPVSLTVSCNIEGATVWRIAGGKWSQVGVANVPMSLAPFIFQTLEVRAPEYESKKITFAAAEPGEDLGERKVELTTLLIPSVVPPAVPVETVVQNVPVEPPQPASPATMEEKKPIKISTEEFVRETDDFVQYALSDKLMGFQDKYPAVSSDSLMLDRCWDSLKNQKESSVEEIYKARVILYASIYWRAVSPYGGKSLNDAVRYKPNRPLQEAWSVLKNGEPSATKDFYNWLSNEGGHRAIENFVRLAIEPRR